MATNTTIDTLEVKISANAQAAVNSLKSLSRALQSVKTALTGVNKDGVSASGHIAKSLNEMNGALNTITTNGIKRLQKLANSLQDYGDAIKKVKSTGSAGGIAKDLKLLGTSINVLTGFDKNGVSASDQAANGIRDLNHALGELDIAAVSRLRSLTSVLNAYADALRNIKSVGATTNITKGIKALGGSGEASEKIKKVKEKTSVKDDTAEMPAGTKRVHYKPEQLKQMGVFSHHAANETERLTSAFSKLGGVFGKVQKFTGTVRKEFKSLRDQLHFTNGKLLGFVRALGRIAFYRAIRAAIKAVTEAFSEGLKNAYLYSKQSEGFERLANALDRLKSVTSQMVNQLGAFWGEFRQFIQPAIEWIIEKVRQLTEFLTELFAGLNGADQYQYAVLEALNWDDATDSLKKYKQQLLGLDEINNLSTKEKDKDDPLKKFELKPVRESFKQIGQAFQSIKGAIEGAMKEIGDLALLPLGMGALGLIFLFTGHPLLGIPLILKVVEWTLEEAKWNNEENTNTIEKFFKEYKDMFTTASNAAMAVGAMLLFVPGHRALGLGLLLGGNMLKDIAEGNTKLSWKNFLSGKFDRYTKMFTKAAPICTAIGAMLLFVPGHRALGLGLIAAGIGLKSLAKEGFDFSWGGLKTTLDDKFKTVLGLFEKGSNIAITLGSILLFVPGQIGLGLGLIAAGITFKSLAEKDYNVTFDELYNTLEEKFTTIRNAYLAVSSFMVAIGTVMLFIPGLEGAGWALIKRGLPGLVVGAATIDWKNVGDNIKKGFSYADSIVTAGNAQDDPITKQVEQILGKDLNYDGKTGWGIDLTPDLVKPEDFISAIRNPNAMLDQKIRSAIRETLYPVQSIVDQFGEDAVWNAMVNLMNGMDLSKEDQTILAQIYGKTAYRNETIAAEENSVWGKTKKEVQTFWDIILQNIEDSVVGETYRFFHNGQGGGGGRSFSPNAMGGINKPGSYFLAGEAGPEFIGRIGNTSAVANTEQMTDAIYRAAYMGMSQALKENGGMNGFEPATTDDLYIAIKKKSNAFSKRTGIPSAI